MPVKGCVVAVLSGVVPAHAVVVVGATSTFADVKVAIHRVARVDQQKGIALARFGDPLDIEVDDVGNSYASGRTLGLELDGHVFYALEVRGQCSPPLGWAAHPPREDFLHGFPLLRTGALIDVERRGPIAIRHGSGSITSGNEIYSVQGSSVEGPFLNVEGEADVAMPIGGLDPRTLHNAGAKDLAVSILEVFAL